MPQQPQSKDLTDSTRALYLGDGLYIINDGFGVQLLANDPREPTDTVVLEPETIQRFIQVLKRWSYIK